MADVQPFKGIRYNTKDLGSKLCPPYDVISDIQQKHLHQSSPNNAVRLELGFSDSSDSEFDNKYTRAAKLLEDWLEDGTLVVEKSPAIYVIQEKFQHEGKRFTRQSIIARVRLEDFSNGVVLPHEETSQGPKKDRFGVISATNANLSPLMGIYREDQGSIANLILNTVKTPPDASAFYESETINLWSLRESQWTKIITQSLKEKKIYLADGHHRYETSLNYMNAHNQKAKMSPDDPKNFVMMCLIEINDPGLIVLPYHRILRNLSDLQVVNIMGNINNIFERESFPLNLNNNPVRVIESLIKSGGANQSSIGLLEYGSETVQILRLKQIETTESILDQCITQILGKKIIEPVVGNQQEAVENGLITYTHDSMELANLVLTGKWHFGFILPSLPLDIFESVVRSGERLPIKSTYFSPKLPTGLVINELV